MKTKKTKRLLWATAIFFVFITIIIITNESYALLETISNGNAEVNTGGWTIKLNEKNISSGVTEKFTLNNITYNNTNPNIDEKYIAPGKSGYFDIILDPTGTEVAISYEIKVNLEDTNYPSNIKFSVEELNSNANITSENNTFTGVISLEEVTKSKTITLRLHLNWENDEQFNEEDTSLGIVENNRFEIPIKVILNQYQG
ncbi:MAG: hypothetical protein Q4C44_03440 [bacterium]|nr:hypothetical protein [bacterium]